MLESAAMVHRIRIKFLPLLLTMLVVTATPAHSQEPLNEVSLTPHQEDQLRHLAGRILQHTDRAGCRKRDCTILVANFTGPTFSTTVLGVKLADTLASQLSAKMNGIRIVDRSSLRDFLEKAHIPSKYSANDHAAGWLASELDASVVLVGSLEREGSAVRLHVQLLNAKAALTKEKKDKDIAEELVLTIQNPDSALAPAVPAASGSPTNTPTQGEKAFKAGVAGVGMPTCYHRPDPQYTEAGRDAKFTGTVLLAIVISADGIVSNPQIVLGAPFGLNESALSAVSRWKCKPATRGGTPVPSLVNVEITFRLF